MQPRFPLRQAHGWQVGGYWPLDEFGTTANGMSGIAVNLTTSVETNVSGWFVVGCKRYDVRNTEEMVKSKLCYICGFSWGLGNIQVYSLLMVVRLPSVYAYIINTTRILELPGDTKNVLTSFLPALGRNESVMLKSRPIVGGVL